MSKMKNETRKKDTTQYFSSLSSSRQFCHFVRVSFSKQAAFTAG
jgi:hypothetical protein